MLYLVRLWLSLHWLFTFLAQGCEKTPPNAASYSAEKRQCEPGYSADSHAVSHSPCGGGLHGALGDLLPHARAMATLPRLHFKLLRVDEATDPYAFHIGSRQRQSVLECQALSKLPTDRGH